MGLLYYFGGKIVYGGEPHGVLNLLDLEIVFVKGGEKERKSE